ncbi:MAG TPA: RidA family protein [Candidatus Binataceae bacterium]|nr:RidA family protein [Candidatus Binataceae bacterium]
MADIERISTSSPYEPIAGYSRLVRAGDYIFVSGTTAFDERGLLVGAGQMYVQARQCLTNIEAALKRVGATMANVVRTRMFVTDISRFNDAARAHGEFFAATRPATSMVEVKALVSPPMLIEIEADVYLPQARVVSSAASTAAATPAKARRTPKAPAAPKAKARSAAKKPAAKTRKRR